MLKKHPASLYIIVTMVVVLPLILWGATYGLNLIAPMSEGSGLYHASYMALLIALGLVIPYFMLKLMTHAARDINPDENVLEIKDLAKNQEDAIQSMELQHTDSNRTV